MTDGIQDSYLWEGLPRHKRRSANSILSLYIRGGYGRGADLLVQICGIDFGLLLLGYDLLLVYRSGAIMINQCRLCGSNELQLWMTDGHNCDLNYYRCSVCTLWNYDLSLGLDQSQYTDSYISPTVTDFKHNVDIRQSWEYLKIRNFAPGKLMDIGCGNACLLHLARQEGWQVHGMELTQSTADAIKNDQGIDIIVANFLDYQSDEPASFDLVVLRHVLEHLPDSILAMSQIGSLLKVNGYALLEFPNTGSFSYAIKRWLKNRGLKNKKYSPEWRPGHCNEFCRRSFNFLLEKTSFELVDWQTYSSKPWMNPFYRVFPIASKARVLVRKIH